VVEASWMESKRNFEWDDHDDDDDRREELSTVLDDDDLLPFVLSFHSIVEKLQKLS